MRGLQPEHQRYWLAWYLWLRTDQRERLSDIFRMSLNQIDLAHLALDAWNDAKPKPKGA